MATSPRAGRPRSRVSAGWLGAVVAGLLVLAGPVATVAAHATFVSMSPAEGSLVTTAPTEVVITFNQPIQDIGTSFLVTAPSGASVASGAPVVEGSTVTQALVPLVEQGTYAVAYRVTSTDGHPVSRGLTFAFGSRSSAGTPVAAAAGSSPAPPERSPVVAVLAGLGLVVALLLAYQAVRRSRTRGLQPAGGQEPPPEDTW